METVQELTSAPITIGDIIGYFLCLAVLFYMGSIIYKRNNELWTGIKGPDGILQTVEMLIAEYLIIMPVVLLSNVFLKIHVEHDVWEFLKQITAFLLAGQVGKQWITKHYETKKQKNDNSKDNSKDG